ncbi:sensor histidine kinase [Roseibium sediminicola]|uniref:histidine kinase n=1 Tax=Roseibium sediminicola TaxID=2933272 RepID=A0ABT0GPF2_9HYPH|nr:HAMP domain-containing sensor histidine kinase [Roseibium sp. CAU 1639]MCK7611315.1 HAMP domain-containing histidine kinase [Roseibium sp. CAU 1639]
MSLSGSTSLPYTPKEMGRASLSRTFILYTLGLFAILGVIFIGILTKITWDASHARAIRVTEAFFQATKRPFERAIWTVNADATLQLIRGLESLEVVEKVWVETPDTGNFGEPVTGARASEALSYTLNSPSTILHKDAIGQVYILIDRNTISYEIVSTVGFIVTAIIIYLLLLAIVIRTVFRRLIGQPLSAIVEYLSTPRLIEDPPKAELMPGRADEIGILSASLQSMVQRRHLDLQKIQEYQTNLEDLVAHRTEQLKLVQEELIQADNLAALGALVAGVSHELNTPLGNALMAATTIKDSTGYLSKELEQQSLSKEALENEVDRISETANIIEKTLGRARELVGNFRQVAVDRQSEKKRSFNFDHIIRETLATLQPTLKKTPFTVEMDLHADEVIDSYPGAVSQLVSNLVENAIKHGYEGRSEGVIKLSSRVVVPMERGRASPKDKKVIFKCQDFGVGIPEKNLKKVFEPFFTTKFGKGGSGLGMAICYQLVTEALNGTISVGSKVGSGTEFTIEFPAEAVIEASKRHGQKVH